MATTPPCAPADAVQFDGRVLLVEDNPVNLELIARLLNRLGCRLETAGNGAAAVARMAGEPFDLVLMDCEMPVMDGFEAAARIRDGEHVRQRPRTPIIALTAHAAADAYRRCLAAGMDAVLGKPINRADLVAGLRPWLLVRASIGGEVGRLDVAVLDGVRELAGDQPAVLAGIVSQFAAIAPQLAGAVRASSQSGDLEALWRAAHSLKSSAGALGAGGLARRCGEIEKRARDVGARPDPHMLDGLDAEIAAAIDGLRAVAAGGAT